MSAGRALFRNYERDRLVFAASWGSNVAFCDGSVRFIKSSVNPITWAGLGQSMGVRSLAQMRTDLRLPVSLEGRRAPAATNTNRRDRFVRRISCRSAEIVRQEIAHDGRSQPGSVSIVFCTYLVGLALVHVAGCGYEPAFCTTWPCRLRSKPAVRGNFAGTIAN